MQFYSVTQSFEENNLKLKFEKDGGGLQIPCPSKAVTHFISLDERENFSRILLETKAIKFRILGKYDIASFPNRVIMNSLKIEIGRYIFSSSSIFLVILKNLYSLLPSLNMLRHSKSVFQIFQLVRFSESSEILDMNFLQLETSY